MNDLRILPFERVEHLLAVDDRTPAGWLLALLIPLSRLYGLAMRARASLYARGLLKQQSLPCRVISVGNLTIGGTGKTPVVIALATALRDRGRKVGVISRGYKRRSRTSILEISDGRTLRGHPGDSGDEPFLIAQRCPGVPVTVRAAAPAVPIWITDFAPSAVVQVGGSTSVEPSVLKGERVLAVSGIGNPESFRWLLAAVGATVVDHCVFADHHAYSQDDLGRIRRSAAQAGVDRIVTTEKDAVKLAQLIQTLSPSEGEGRVRGDIWAVRIDLRWLEGFDEWNRVVING